MNDIALPTAYLYQAAWLMHDEVDKAAGTAAPSDVLSNAERKDLFVDGKRRGLDNLEPALNAVGVARFIGPHCPEHNVSDYHHHIERFLEAAVHAAAIDGDASSISMKDFNRVRGGALALVLLANEIHGRAQR